MKRPELADDQKLAFLERLVARLFGYNTKVDWEQDFIGGLQKIIIRDIHVDGETLDMLDSLRNKDYEISIDSRAYVDSDPTFYPSPSEEGEKYRALVSEIDIEIYEPWVDDILRSTPERIEEVKDGWMFRVRWSEEDSKREDHHYVDSKNNGVHPMYHRPAPDK